MSIIGRFLPALDVLPPPEAMPVTPAGERPARPVPFYRAQRVMPPPEPPLAGVEPDLDRDDLLPDPYGPDPMVFGSVPHPAAGH